MCVRVGRVAVCGLCVEAVDLCVCFVGVGVGVGIAGFFFGGAGGQGGLFVSEAGAVGWGLGGLVYG